MYLSILNYIFESQAEADLSHPAPDDDDLLPEYEKHGQDDPHGSTGVGLDGAGGDDVPGEGGDGREDTEDILVGGDELEGRGELAGAVAVAGLDDELVGCAGLEVLEDDPAGHRVRLVRPLLAHRPPEDTVELHRAGVLTGGVPEHYGAATVQGTHCYTPEW